VAFTSGSDPEVHGKVGHVIIRIRGAAGPGEVLVKVRGGTEAFIAYADEAIDRGEDVLVVASRGQRSVDVVPWEVDDEIEQLPPPPPLDPGVDDA
jgi:hypothetical protein